MCMQMCRLVLKLLSRLSRFKGIKFLKGDCAADSPCSKKCYHENFNPLTEAAADCKSMSPVTAGDVHPSGAGASSLKVYVIHKPIAAQLPTPVVMLQIDFVYSASAISMWTVPKEFEIATLADFLYYC